MKFKKNVNGELAVWVAEEAIDVYVAESLKFTKSDNSICINFSSKYKYNYTVFISVVKREGQIVNMMESDEHAVFRIAHNIFKARHELFEELNDNELVEVRFIVTFRGRTMLDDKRYTIIE